MRTLFLLVGLVTCSLADGRTLTLVNASSEVAKVELQFSVDGVETEFQPALWCLPLATVSYDLSEIGTVTQSRVFTGTDGSLGYEMGGMPPSGPVVLNFPAGFESDNSVASYTYLTAFWDFPAISVPLIGEVAVPTGITANAAAFFAGFCAMAGVRIFRAFLRWFKRAGTERHD